MEHSLTRGRRVFRGVPSPWPYVLGALSGTSCALHLRMIVVLPGEDGDLDPTFWIFAVMAVSFLFVAPFVIGMLAVRPLRVPRPVVAALAGWPPSILSVASLWITGMDGPIRETPALPVMLFVSSMGGLVMRWIATRHVNGASFQARAARPPPFDR